MDAVIVYRLAGYREMATPEIIRTFHQIARQRGSSAYWVPEEGLLIATDPGEPDKGFQYEEWVLQAIKASQL